MDVCQGADGLVIEATYLREEEEMARQFSHLTAHDAASLALRAGVRQLFLTHFSRRYRDKDILAEAEETFPGTILARDLDQYQVKHL
jgi:ribonuclease Z